MAAKLDQLKATALASGWKPNHHGHLDATRADGVTIRLKFTKTTVHLMRKLVGVPRTEWVNVATAYEKDVIIHSLSPLTFKLAGLRYVIGTPGDPIILLPRTTEPAK